MELSIPCRWPVGFIGFWNDRVILINGGPFSFYLLCSFILSRTLQART